MVGSRRHGGAGSTRARARACCSMDDTSRSSARTLRSSMTAYSSSTSRPALGTSGTPAASFSRSVLPAALAGSTPRS